MPGGIALETLDQEIEHAKELAEEIKEERKPEIQRIINEGGANLDSEANKRMVEIGLNPSPSGLDLSYYKNIANTDPRLAVVGLRLDFELMLRNLAKGFRISIEDKEPLSRVISKLYKEQAITPRQYEFINIVFRISDAATHGSSISKEQAYQGLDIGQVLVDDYVAWLDWGFRKQVTD